MDKAMINKYCERIGVDATGRQADIGLLRELQYRHVLSVPYENLDIIRNIPLSLKEDDLYEKIVLKHRGGYCFELNALFSALLLGLGYEVKSYFARFLRGEKELPMRRHRVLRVECEDGVYICDVGIGQIAPRYPLKLETGLLQEQNGETYRFEYDEKLGYVLWELYKGEWRRYFSFFPEEQIEIDFLQPSFFCEKHPDSVFNKTAIVAIKTEKGRKSINDREYKEFIGEEPILIKSDLSDGELSEILRTEFGISF